MHSSTIFLTGATGFIGSHVVKAALAAGNRVRLSVRKEEQIKTLTSLFPSYASLLEFVIIPDISKAEAFEDVLQDVDYVLHLASPMPGKGDDFRTDYLEPAVDGTLSVLNAAKASNTVKRVVITSSVLACIPLGSINASDMCIKEDQHQQLQFDPAMRFPEGAEGHGPKYHASKILAHQATTEWMKGHDPQFSLVTLHPSFVLGHSLIQDSAEDISGINALLWGSLRSPQPQFPPIFVDVRDVAEAHLKATTALTNSRATEILLSGSPSNWDEVLSFIKTNFPSLEVHWEAPFAGGPRVDTSRAENVLSMEWRSMDEIFQSLFDQQLQLVEFNKQ